jgi:TRAP-type C4-dicarboxylate transport system substrate-binding protein
MSREYFESLDEDLRLAILESSREVGRFHRELGEKEDERFRKLLEERMEVTEIDQEAFAAAAEPLYREFEEKFGAEMVDTVRSYHHSSAASAP